MDKSHPSILHNVPGNYDKPVIKLYLNASSQLHYVTRLGREGDSYSFRVHADPFRLPFRNYAFDEVIIANMPTNLEKQTAILSEANRIGRNVITHLVDREVNV